MKRLLILVEGQSEETFVRDVLAPHLTSFGKSAIPVILKTKRVKAGGAFRGGVTSTPQVLGDVRRLLGDSDAVAVTTLIDYYGLPDDFPGLSSRPASDPYARVAHAEKAFSDAVDHPRFIAHLTLHELESWIFSAPNRCAWVFAGANLAPTLAAIAHQHGGAERINERRDTCPSRQLIRAYPAYQKTLDGPLALTATGLAAIRAACPHAAAWLSRLEAV